MTSTTTSTTKPTAATAELTAQVKAIFSHLADDQRRQLAGNVPCLQTRMLTFRPAP